MLVDFIYASTVVSCIEAIKSFISPIFSLSFTHNLFLYKKLSSNTHMYVHIQTYVNMCVVCVCMLVRTYAWCIRESISLMNLRGQLCQRNV